MNLQRHIAVWLAVVGMGCTQQPLPGPLGADRVVQDGMRIWLADGDLPSLAATARALAGTEVALVTAPFGVPATGGAQLGPLHAALRLESASAEWLSSAVLRFAFQVEAGTLPLALGYPGAAACALSFVWPATPLLVDLRLGLVQDGAPQATLASAPKWPTQLAELQDPQGCLEGLSQPSIDAIRSQVWQELQTATASRATVGAAGAAQALLDGPWPLAARFVVDNTPIDWQITPLARSAADGQTFLAGPEDQRFGRIALGVDAPRHPCAPDVAPPQLEAVWPAYPAAPGGGVSVARRGLALHAAGLAHLGWAAVRAGLLCRTSTSWGEALGEGWGTPIAPALQAWLDGPPRAARLWPGSSPAVEVVDGVDGPELSWRLDDATLEIVGTVGGEEAVVVVIRGRLRLRTALLGTGNGLRMATKGVALEAATVSSPLFGDALPPNSPGDVRTLVEAAMTGIIGDLPVFPLEALAPAGTTLTGTARGGNALWLWLDSSPL